MISICWLLLARVILSASIAQYSSQCNHKYSNNYDTTKLEFETVPVGRVFLEKELGLFLLYSNNIGSDEAHSPYGIGSNLQGKVDVCCMQRFTHQYESNCLVQNISEITLHVRLVGPEILIPDKIYCSNNSWYFIFPTFKVDGIFTLEIVTTWINGKENPQRQFIDVPPELRTNQGRIIHLGAMGVMPYFATDSNWKNYSFERLMLRSLKGQENNAPPYRNAGKDVFLIYNGTRRKLPRGDAFKDLGFGSFPIFGVSAAFLNTFPLGKDISDSLNPLPQPVSNVSKPFEKMLNKLKGFTTLLYGNPFRNFSYVSGTPTSVTVVSDRNITSNVTEVYLQKRRSYYSLPVCNENNELISGRWVYEPNCDKYDSTFTSRQRKSQELDYNSECKQASTVALLTELRHRSKSMVWRPHTCRLLLEGATAGLEEEEPISPSNCFKKIGIGFVAGFGDSIGDEIHSDISAMVGKYEVPVQGPGKEGLVCRGGKTDYNPGRQNFHILSSIGPLATCVEDSAKLLRSESTSRNVTSVVLVTNFMVHHMLSGQYSMMQIESFLRRQAKVHKNTELRIKNMYNLKYRRMFYSGVAPHGFRFQGFTPPRVEMVNKLACDILKPYGWEIIDVYNMTSARPDGTSDGLHYHGGVSIAMSQVLLTAVCHG